MSIKSKVMAAAAVLTVTAGLAAAGPVSWAATPSCGIGGAQICANIFSRDFGTHKTPGFVLDVLRQGAAPGQPIILFRTANSDPAEDFTVSYQGLVSDFYQAGLASSSINIHYGCGYNIQTGLCSTNKNPITGLPFPDDWAFEIQYSPYGVLSGLCVGTGTTATAGTKVALEPCGATSKTVWVIDQADSSSGQMNVLRNEYVPLINASETNFSNPYVLTYPGAAYPTDKPRAQFTTQNLTGFSNPGTGDPAGVNSNQLFGATLGPLK
jgi:hypothetical protein